MRLTVPQLPPPLAQLIQLDAACRKAGKHLNQTLIRAGSHFPRLPVTLVCEAEDRCETRTGLYAGIVEQETTPGHWKRPLLILWIRLSSERDWQLREGLLGAHTECQHRLRLELPWRSQPSFPQLDHHLLLCREALEDYRRAYAEVVQQGPALEEELKAYPVLRATYCRESNSPPVDTTLTQLAVRPSSNPVHRFATELELSGHYHFHGLLGFLEKPPPPLLLSEIAVP